MNEPLPATDGPVALVVEDDSFSNAMLTSFMVDLGYTAVSASNGAQAIADLNCVDPDICLLDLDLGEGPDGTDVAWAVYQKTPWSAIVMLSSHSATELVSSRQLPPTPFLTYVIKGQLHATSQLQEAVTAALAGEGSPAATRSLAGATLITVGQAELLRMIAQGLSNEEIARRKSVRPSSVERMIARLYRELGLPESRGMNPRVEAARRYLSGGIAVR